MAFPITVDPDLSVCEQPGLYGPFTIGADLYMVNGAVTDGSAVLTMMKSTDSGLTWAPVGTGPNSLLFGITLQYTCVLAGTSIWTLYTDLDLGQNAAVEFTANAWGTPVPCDDDLGFGLVAAYRSIDGVIVVAAPCGAVMIEGINHIITQTTTFDTDAETWGTLTDLGYEDYDEITLWNQVPCGVLCDSSGRVQVFMQQLTFTPSDQPTIITLGASGTFDVPGDCVELSLIQVWGAGGGGGTGGGGGGGYTETLNIPVTPGDAIDYVVGIGGPTSNDGEASNFLTTMAGGGLGGDIPAGGVGGSGTFAGGTGGDGDAAGGGGGGGGSATPTANGGNGIDGGPMLGGGGGAGQGAGGDGANRDGANAVDGAVPGGGGGGSAGGVASGAGTGGDGQIVLTYTPSTADNPGRLWHQSIAANGALGTITEIPQASSPIDGPVYPFNCSAGLGTMAVALTGVISTTDSSILVGRAGNGVAPSFSIDTVQVGNEDSQISSNPAVSINDELGTMFLFYLRATSQESCDFVYRSRLTTGGTWGTPTLLGSLLNIGCRMLALSDQNKVNVAFGTPTTATVIYTSDD